MYRHLKINKCDYNLFENRGTKRCDLKFDQLWFSIELDGVNIFLSYVLKLFYFVSVLSLLGLVSGGSGEF